jgi:hypothetical protein
MSTLMMQHLSLLIFIELVLDLDLDLVDLDHLDQESTQSLMSDKLAYLMMEMLLVKRSLRGVEGMVMYIRYHKAK